MCDALGCFPNGFCFIVGSALDVQNKAGEHPLLTAVIYHSNFKVNISVGMSFIHFVVVVLLLNVHGQQLRSCWDGQLT